MGDARTQYRCLAAIVIAAVGTTVLWRLGVALFGLVGGYWNLTSCTGGALATGFLAANPDRVGFRSNLRPAAGVVFGTFAVISAGHTLEQVLVRRVPIDFEPLGLGFWATVLTAWWLIPSVAVVLMVLNRAGARWAAAQAAA